MFCSSSGPESSEDSTVSDKSVFVVKNFQAEELRLQISLSLGDLGELREHCCREWGVPQHLARFVCLGHTYGVDHDTVRLTDVLAGARVGPNQEHLIWFLWVLVTNLNAIWLQFFADCSSDFRKILVARELAARHARLARYPRQASPGRRELGKPTSPGF